MKIDIVKQGITKISADCIVNAANSDLTEGGGVCGAIFEAAGSAQLTQDCNRIGHCDTGSAVITPAFRLDAKYIIHAVGPIYIDGNHHEPQMLYDCYKKSLELAMEYKCHSIVFPVISAGIFGYPKDAAWRKAIQACLAFEKKNPDYRIHVYFAVPQYTMAKLGKETIESEKAKLASARTSNVNNKNNIIHVPKLDWRGKNKIQTERMKVFDDTMHWIASDDTLTASVAQSKKNTTVYKEDDYPEFDHSKIKDQTVIVTNHRSFEAAMEYHKENPNTKIAVMNFANAFHPGGGVKEGAGAQEECLCRCSTLYPVLYRRSLKKEYYDYHRYTNNDNPKATDRLIYSEDVVICKTDTFSPKRMEKKDWVMVDVITIAAPDLRKRSNRYVKLSGGGTVMNNAELFGYHVKRAIHMLTVAAHEGADMLVLGAFGCGAFKNDPEVVARAYKTALAEFPKVFDRVEFAIYCKPEDTKNYDTFRHVLGD